MLRAGTARPFTLAGLVLPALTIGCASFRGGALPKVKDLPSRASARLSATVKLTLLEPGEGKVHEAKPGKTADRQGELIEILRESGYFSSVAPDLSDPDLVIDATLAVETEGGEGGELAGMTLGLVPEESTVKYSFEAKVTSVRLKRDWTVTLSDYYKNWIHLFLLPLAPFRPEPVVARGVRKNLFRHFALELHRQGILDAVMSGDTTGR